MSTSDEAGRTTPGAPRGRGHHAPDGSALQVYLHLPPGPTADIVDAALGRHSHILELGSGPGRVTRPLVSLGHTVTAVDESSQMLAHVTGAEVVCADARTLRLHRRFDAVLLGSHLINHPDRAIRRALLRTCARHVTPGGVVLIERFGPDWAPREGSLGRRGAVDVSLEGVSHRGSTLFLTVVYVRGEERWEHAVTARVLDDADLAHEMEQVGLIFGRSITPDRRWVSASPQG